MIRRPGRWRSCKEVVDAWFAVGSGYEVSGFRVDRRVDYADMRARERVVSEISKEIRWSVRLHSSVAGWTVLDVVSETFARLGWFDHGVLELVSGTDRRLEGIFS